MTPLDLVKLTPLMKLTSGVADVSIGLVDGPVVMNHPELKNQHVREISGSGGSACTQINSTACLHGTFIAGILSAIRGSAAPAICPDCTLLIRPIFAESRAGNTRTPSATPEELAAAIMDCIVAGARCINLSLALARPSSTGERGLEQVLDHAVRRGVVIVAAAGNQGTLGSSAITRHPWVIPVVACDGRGRPMTESNLGNSIGRRGLMAPGDRITSLGSDGKSFTFGGTSVAVPFVIGAIALLWSEFPTATAAQIKLAVTQANSPRRASVVPPLLDAAAAFRTLSLSAAASRRQTV
ncbi:MAG TPA: S8 family serine peptidase [Pyrinomonadaceae bacterium]|nr:S8 family serine peptidase [Pyrinomonadaceae bacterium]